MTKTFALLTAGVAFAALNLAPAASAMPLTSLQQAAPTGLVQVYHHGRPHRRARITRTRHYERRSRQCRLSLLRPLQSASRCLAQISQRMTWWNHN